MASQIVKRRQWTCDGCGVKEDTALDHEGVPERWKGCFTFRCGDIRKPLQLCPACSVKPTPIVKAWEKKHDGPRRTLLQRIFHRHPAGQLDSRDELAPPERNYHTV